MNLPGCAAGIISLWYPGNPPWIPAISAVGERCRWASPHIHQLGFTTCAVGMRSPSTPGGFEVPQQLAQLQLHVGPRRHAPAHLSLRGRRRGAVPWGSAAMALPWQCPRVQLHLAVVVEPASVETQTDRILIHHIYSSYFVIIRFFIIDRHF